MAVATARKAGEEVLGGPPPAGVLADSADLLRPADGRVAALQLGQDAGALTQADDALAA